MPSLSKAKTVAESIQQQQDILQSLESEVKDLLSENDRLDDVAFIKFGWCFGSVIVVKLPTDH